MKKPSSVRANESWQDALQAYARELRQRFGPSRKLLLVQAPGFLFETINPEVIRNRGYYAYPPTGLQRLATSLSGRDIEVQILDLNLQTLKYIAQDGHFDPKKWLAILDDHLEAFKPDIVGVTCLTVYTDLFAGDHPLTSVLRHLSDKDEHMVVIGGPTATNEADRYVREGLCHFAVEGEGEDRLNFLLDVYENRFDLSAAASGIVFPWRGRALKTRGQCAPARLRGDLISSYESVDVEAYCHVGSLNPYSRMAGQDTVYGVFQLNRGCRGNCKFCGVRAFMGKGVRTHPVDEVVREVRYLIEERSVRHFELLDDDFLADREAAARFLIALGHVHREHNVTWAANNGLMTRSITRDLLDLMRDSGCLGFKIGIESGDPDMLRRIRKPGTLASFHKVARMLDDYPELFVGGNYIVGLLGEETFGQMLETFACSVRLNLDWSSFTVFQLTSKPNALAENLKADGAGATDFIPGKDTSTREMQEDRSLPLGPDVFSIPTDSTPSRPLIRNIWMTFNLLGNYIGNKNLKPGGRPEKFVSWVDAVRVAYPNNPYALLFAGLGRVLTGESEMARWLFRDAKEIVSDSGNWQYCFARFGIDALLHRTPERPNQVYESLAEIWSSCLSSKLPLAESSRQTIGSGETGCDEASLSTESIMVGMIEAQEGTRNQKRKEVVVIVGFYLPGIYPAGDDAVVSDLLAPALIKATADADPEITARYEIRRFNFPTTIDPAEAARQISAAQPVLVAYSVYIWNYGQTMECSQLTKKSLGDVPIVMGGPQVMYCAVEEMEKHPQIDVIVHGNGELRFKRLLKEGLVPESLAQIPHIVYRDRKGRIVHTAGDVTEDVAQIPSPYANGTVDLDDGQRHTVFLETFRGCPFQCGYCVWGDNNIKMCKFDLDQILNDIDIVYNNPNVEVVYITDACLFYTRKRAKAICDRIAACSRKVPTVMTLDIRTLDEEIIKCIGQVNLIRNQFHFGLQTTNTRALHLLNRQDTKEVFIEKIDLLRRIRPGAQISLDLIYGLPGDNHEGFRESVDFAYSLNPGKLYLSHLLLLPGTPFWDKKEALGFDHTDEPPYMVRSNTQYTQEDMRKTMAWVMWIQVMNYFHAIKDAIVGIRGIRPEHRAIELIDRFIAIVSERVDPVTGLSHEFTIESTNRNRRQVMNTFAEPANGLILYEAAWRLLEECQVDRQLGENVKLGIEYYGSLCRKGRDAGHDLIATHGRRRIQYVQAKWKVSNEATPV